MTAKPKCLVFARAKRQGNPPRRVLDWKVIVGRTHISGTAQGYANRSALRQSMRQTVRGLLEFLFIEDSIKKGYE